MMKITLIICVLVRVNTLKNKHNILKVVREKHKQ